MGITALFRELFPRPALDCEHLAAITNVTPSSPDSCLQCVETGDSWVNLRICLECGQVGCCDNSKNTHATKHHHQSGHAIIQSFQPGERWRFCYIDDAKLTDGEPLR